MDVSCCSNLSSRYRPELVKRMQESKCFRCDEIGHWSWDCPFPAGHVKKPTTSFSSSGNRQTIFCRCGHGPCVVSTHSSGRNFYACPITRGKACGGYKKRIEWCDDGIEESYKEPPPDKYPECDCGAGVCRKVEDPDVHKYYFACPVPRGHGACDYIVWEDELLDNKVTVPIQQISQNHDYELGKGSDLVADGSKEMRVLQNSECPLLMVLSDEHDERDNAVEEPNGDPSSFVDFPEFEDADVDYLQEIVNSGEWDAVEKKALQSFSWSTTSKIGFQQVFFRNNGFSGRCSMGWLGYLIFLHPSRSLEFPTPRPFFCCIFPSFDKIITPKEAIIVNNSRKYFNEHVQLSSNGCGRYETWRDFTGDTLTVSQGSERKPMSKGERKRQMVLVAQQELLRDLESLLDQDDHESMRVCAEDTFALLDDLSVDYKKFSEHIWDFIDNISAVVDIKSMENCLVEELSQCINKERERLAEIKEEFLAAEALLKESNQNEQRLREEVSRLEAMLQEKQNKLKSCELERLEIEIRLGDLKKKITEVDTTLKGRVKEAELARRHNEERQTKKMAAMVALEKAKRVVED
ncbi:hypothetical protein HN51_016539 [Arachis hypogaea]|uniref:CCHC-type domain-containing protein n=2 Tax=Arachis TaxID=3817 RepID=A0A445CTI5_ARAHY|nr:uncharacterized protein LOC112697076 [Arachis hypogaea]QHO47123.1 uncharacterized protein DS421_6g193610 [Arachis hypogaea]RYR54175.1 hypothetical protein Ahy_A06g029429 [Arachis hypogaea]